MSGIVSTHVILQIVFSSDSIIEVYLQHGHNGKHLYLSIKIQNEHGDEVAKLKQQIMEQELEKKKILCNRVFQRIVNRQLVCAWEEWRHHVKTQNLPSNQCTI